MGLKQDFGPVLFCEMADRRHVVGEHAFERFLGFPLRMLCREHVHTVEREHSLPIERVFDPERAILIEGRDTVFRCDERLIRLIGGGANEIQDALFRRPVVPRRQRIGGLLRMR
jgi:hypothetical protein